MTRKWKKMISLKRFWVFFPQTPVTAPLKVICRMWITDSHWSIFYTMNLFFLGCSTWYLSSTWWSVEKQTPFTTEGNDFFGLFLNENPKKVKNFSTFHKTYTIKCAGVDFYLSIIFCISGRTSNFGTCTSTQIKWETAINQTGSVFCIKKFFLQVYMCT